jgi:hypothetical protein
MGIDYEKFKRHCNMGIDIELENDKGEKDIFKLKPLNIMQVAEFQNLAQKEKNGTINIEDNVRMIELLQEIITNSYPGLDEDIAENFALNNIQDFMLVMNKLVPRTDERKLRQIQKMKQLAEAKLKQQEIIKENDTTGHTENTE